VWGPPQGVGREPAAAKEGPLQPAQLDQPLDGSMDPGQRLGLRFELIADGQR